MIYIFFWCNIVFSIMRVMIWNVNGIRAIQKKRVLDDLDFESYISSSNCDIVCFNETKICLDKLQKLNLFTDYLYQYHSNSCNKKGYSGVSIYSKIMPLKEHAFAENSEGRVVCLEYHKFILVAVYQPNSGSTLARIEYRVNKWATVFLQFIKRLQKSKPVMIVGDMNVARSSLDVKDASRHTHSAGYTESERIAFDKLLNDCNLVDSWRIRHPNSVEYTYFDYRSRARERNAGWRIDYVLCSSALDSLIKSVSICSNVMGSDHVPLICELSDVASHTS